ncbi:endonuclease/exonuclease/phosphatase family protein [Streptomyces longispororuber]|uniref:endonuclease/exonuclease/phosphatase family protein n=1 Tax=Streptomyces longispororuber TaxID=68230 RepID=UPI0021087A80|nr:endonuclease/exonuclease/phosphatase family protein [Streptomyces longispororuber]MCQ4207575.1 endonuclease/exonuclease/phosphatase family protein [Streptomyces longispororuber]
MNGRGFPEDEYGLRVMSLNLQVHWDNPPHTWPERRPAVGELLRGARPHLLGTQEGLRHQVRDVEAALGSSTADYDWVGEGRDGGDDGEFMALFYDRRRLAALAHGHFWLSGTPDVPGSNTWGGGCPRMVTWARFRDLVTGTEFCAANTHFDHASADARERSAELLAERLNALVPDVPRIVTGDFNSPAGPGSSPYTRLLAAADLVDAWDTAEERGPDLGTFHDYRPPVPGGERIDWILVSRGVRVRSAHAYTFAPGGRFPSDHLPIHAVVHTAPSESSSSPSRPSSEDPTP